MSSNRSLDVSPRDLLILKVRVANPSAPVRVLSTELEEEYGISLSHNRINEILHELHEQGLYRETILPDESLFRHYQFKIALYFPNFEEEWDACRRYLVEDPHVLMFFNADGTYQWQVITQFRRSEQMERWVHEFFKEFGSLISEFENTALHNVHKFNTDAEIFDDVLEETAEGREFVA